MITVIRNATYAISHEKGTEAIIEDLSFEAVRLPRGLIVKIVDDTDTNGWATVSLEDGTLVNIPLIHDVDQRPILTLWGDYGDEPVQLIKGSEYMALVDIELYLAIPKNWRKNGFSPLRFESNDYLGTVEAGTRLRLEKVPSREHYKTSRNPHRYEKKNAYGEIYVLDGPYAEEYGYIVFNNNRSRPCVAYLKEPSADSWDHISLPSVEDEMPIKLMGSDADFSSHLSNDDDDDEDEHFSPRANGMSHKATTKLRLPKNSVKEASWVLRDLERVSITELGKKKAAAQESSFRKKLSKKSSKSQVSDNSAAKRVTLEYADSNSNSPKSHNTIVPRKSARETIQVYEPGNDPRIGTRDKNLPMAAMIYRREQSKSTYDIASPAMLKRATTTNSQKPDVKARKSFLVLRSESSPSKKVQERQHQMRKSISIQLDGFFDDKASANQPDKRANNETIHSSFEGQNLSVRTISHEQMNMGSPGTYRQDSSHTQLLPQASHETGQVSTVPGYMSHDGLSGLDSPSSQNSQPMTPLAAQVRPTDAKKEKIILKGGTHSIHSYSRMNSLRSLQSKTSGNSKTSIVVEKKRDRTRASDAMRSIAQGRRSISQHPYFPMQDGSMFDTESRQTKQSRYVPQTTGDEQFSPKAIRFREDPSFDSTEMKKLQKKEAKHRSKSTPSTPSLFKSSLPKQGKADSISPSPISRKSFASQGEGGYSSPHSSGSSINKKATRVQVFKSKMEPHYEFSSQRSVSSDMLREDHVYTSRTGTDDTNNVKKKK